MSGMRFLLEQLNPAMREQAARKLDALRAHSAERVHVCADGKAVPSRLAATPKQRRPTRQQIIPKLSEPEERLAFHLKAEGLGGFERQYRWCPGRAYRADFAYIAPKLLIEVQGGVHTGGAHTRGAGYEYDRQRNNEAVVLGWCVLEFTPAQVKSGHAVHTIRRALEAFRT